MTFQTRYNTNMTKPAAQPELKIVMIGRSKVGKSATGNTILGRTAFKSCIYYNHATKKCRLERVRLKGRSLSVIDTPGLFGAITSDSFDEEDPGEVMEKIKQCLLDAPLGPVVFLVVLQLGSFTEPEQQTIKVIQRSFGGEAEHYTMALFTRGDDLKKEEVTIEEVIGANPALRDFIRECRGGYHVFDNGDTNSSQDNELLRKINAIVQRNGEQGGLQRKPSRRYARRDACQERRSSSFVQTCIDGGFFGMCTEAVRLAIVMKMTRRTALIELVFGGAVGGMIGAAFFMVCGLIWRGC